MRSRRILLTIAMGALVLQLAPAQGRGGGDAALIAQRNRTEKQLESVAIVERKVMVPMRDGKRMAGRYLPSQGHLEKVSDYLRAHAV